MAFRTFDQIDAEADASSLLRPVTPPEAKTPRGFDTPDTLAKAQEITNRSTWAAAFQSDNLVTALSSRKDAGVDNEDDGDFDPVKYIKDNGLQGHEDSFTGVLNGRLADARKAQIEMERRNKETLDASGFMGTVAQIVAGGLDVPTLIPGTVAIRGARGGFSVARSVFAAGASAAATQALTEGAMHAVQETREVSESVVNVAGAAVLGSLLGGTSAALLGKAERKASVKAAENLSDIATGRISNEMPEGKPGSAGAMANPLTSDEYFLPDAPRTREDMTLKGGVVDRIAAASIHSPYLRGTQRLSSVARQYSDMLYNGTLYKQLHAEGETLGPSAEALIRTRVEAANGSVTKALDDAYNAARKAPAEQRLNLDRKAFAERVGQAMVNADEDASPFIVQAAKSYRKVIDDFTSDAIKLGQELEQSGWTNHPFTALLKEGALDVKTAAGYLMRVPNKDQLLRDEAKFLDTVGDGYYLKVFQKQFDDDAAKLLLSEELRGQRLQDLEAAGPERANRLQMLENAAENLDARFPQHVERNSDIADLERVIREKPAPGASRAEKMDLERKKAEAREARKKLVEEGGAEFKEYQDTGRELRRRRRDLRERNPDAQGERFDRMVERIDEAEATAERYLDTYGRQAKNILNRIASDPVGRTDELIDITTKQIEKLRRLADDAATRANETKAQYLEQMDPQAGFDAAAKRAVREGASGEEAVKRGTKEADRITKQIADAERAVQQLNDRTAKLEALNERLAKRELSRGAAERLVPELEQMLAETTATRAARATRRGEEIAALKQRAAKLSPEEVTKRGEATRKSLDDQSARRFGAFENKWGGGTAMDVVRGDAVDLRQAARDTAQQIYNGYTGRGHDTRPDLPSYISPIARGPAKERLVTVPDEVFDRNNWMNRDVREVVQRFTRSMASDIELARRFRKPMDEVIGDVAKQYSEMQVAVSRATSVEQINEIVGTNFSLRTGLERAKTKATDALNSDRDGAIEDLRGAFDLNRGTYKAEENNTNFAVVARSAMHFTYMAKSGGFALPNIGDLYRPAMVHGLMPYLRHLPGAMAQAVDKGGPVSKALIEEGRLAGLVYSRVNQTMAMSLGDVTDPLVGKVTAVERMLQKGSALASRFNFMDYMNDAAQSVSSILTQHRMIEAITGNGGRAGSSFKNQQQATEYLRMLGVSENTQRDIASLIERHGQDIDGVRVPHTDRWLSEANATGSAREIAKAENAVRIYRTAVNIDVNGTISRKNLGDVPLWGNTPMGKLFLQFGGYTLGAHQNVMLRGMQEDKARFVGSLVAMSSIGALTAYLSAWRGGKERWDKFNKEAAENPWRLVAEGVDRSGLFPLLFDVSNRAEKIAGGFGESYRVNPLKALISLPGGGSPVGITSSRGADTMGPIGALLGPSVGTLDGVYAGGKFLADKARGEPTSKRDFNRAIGVVPGGAHFGMKEALQALNGNSPWLR